LPVKWVKASVWLFTLFYLYLLIKYTRLFVVTYRTAIRKLDNYFSGQEAEHLRWINFSFYAALCIGLLALTISLFPTLHLGIAGMVIYMLFYLWFAVRIINFGFVYKDLEEVLSEDVPQEQKEVLPEDACLEQKDKTALHSTHADTIEKCLEKWLDEKRFLQPGITIDDVSQYIGTNRYYISEHINATKGMTFRRWIIELRLIEAQELMRKHPEMTLNEIATQLGYADKGSLIRQFIKHTGLSPTAWKQNMVVNQ
jgi:AraC-like DNA-binding protein